MTASWRPDLYVQVAFNADPGDLAAVPVWSDLSSKLRAMSGVQRGRQYELDQNQASAPTLSFWDPDEALNIDNPSSPYAPNVVPYRQILVQAVWPNPCAGNLMNSGGQVVQYDPSFESYAPGSTVSWLTNVGGVSAAVLHGTAHGGSQCVTWAVANGATVQGVSWPITCIPGQQYTVSAYVRQSSASTQQISVVGGVTGSSTTTVSAYVRLSVTFTASQPTHTVQVATTGTAVVGSVYLDDVQQEAGGTATTFTSSGSVIYGVFRGYVERWPRTWDYAGYAGRTDVVCVDGFAALAAAKLDTEYANAVVAKAPDYYWRLSESSAATSFAETSGNNGPTLTRMDSKYGAAATFSPGSTLDFVGDPGATGVADSVSAANNTCSIMQTGVTNGLPVGIGGTLSTFACTASIVLARTAATYSGYPLYLTDAGNLNYQVEFLLLQGSPNQIGFQVALPTAGGAYAAATDVWADGKPHLYVGTAQVSGTTLTTKLYVDGTLQATATVSTVGAPSTVISTVAEVGGLISLWGGGAYTSPGVNGGVYAHVALWNRVLSADEIADLGAAASGYASERSDVRVGRYLGYGWAGSTDLSVGVSLCGASKISSDTATLTACQDTTTTENGNFWIDATGTVRFSSRTDRYLALTPANVFGENVAAGELPYQGDISFGNDPQFLFDDITVTNADGFSAHVVDTTAVKRFLRRSPSPISINVQNDLEAVDRANWMLLQYKDARSRLQNMTLDPVGYPALWPVVLGMELGQRDTVVRRAKAANGGAGLTMSGDFFVENINHDGIDLEAGTWQVKLLLSPASNVNPWVLGDSTYGVLDVTTKLGY